MTDPANQIHEALELISDLDIQQLRDDQQEVLQKAIFMLAQVESTLRVDPEKES